MADAHIGLLFRAAASLPSSVDNKTQTLLKSYYMMRCKQVTKGYGLPDKHFSTTVRCSYCCVQWRKGTETKLKPVKLTKKQRKRICKGKKPESNKKIVHNIKAVPNSNSLEITCQFCKRTTTTNIPKPDKATHKEVVRDKIVNSNETKKIKSSEGNRHKQEKKIELNVYRRTDEVFSLKHKTNSLIPQETTKVIKNSKKKKDKCAGLCQTAVLAAAKSKQQNEQNKLNLFLKPSQ